MTTRTATTFPKPILKDDSLYLGDGGLCLCGEHSGASARYAGRDLSGQRVHKVTEADQSYMLANGGRRLHCESHGCSR